MSEWIADQLHIILGMSDVATEKYILAMSKNAKSDTQILDQLLDSQFPATQGTRTFAK